MTKTRPSLKSVILLLALSYVFFMLGNGVLSLTNPDEVFYSQTAKEMMQQGTWLTPYLFGQPQFEKPILTYWFLRLAFEAGGIGNFSARFFPALFGCLGVLVTYLLGLIGFSAAGASPAQAQRNEKKAFFAALLLMSCGLYIGLSRTVFTDLFFTFFILLSLASFFWGYSVPQRRRWGILGFFAAAGFAVLAKGPLGLLIPFLTVVVFLAFRKDLKFIAKGDFFFGFLLCCLIAAPWYALMIKKYGSAFNHEFFYNVHWRRVIEAEHKSNDTWYFYPLTGLGSMFPWTLFVLAAMASLARNLKNRLSSFDLFLLCWVAVVFLIFQPAHSKLVSYIFPFFPALALLTGGYFCEASARKGRSLFFAFAATWCFVAVMPLGLIVASARFSSYLTSRVPVFFFAALLSGYLVVLLFFILKRRFAVSFYALAALLPLCLFFAFSMRSQYEDDVSSKSVCAYLMRHYRQDSPVLCSKFFARGVHFYTDKDVAVLDIGGRGYFSPHPIPFLNTPEKLQSFLSRYPQVYGVLKKSYARNLKQYIGPDFTSEILKNIGDAYIVRISGAAETSP